MTKSDVKAVIFDMDGVVFDTERVWADAYQYSNKVLGSNVSEDYRKTMCGKTSSMIISEMSRDFPGLDAAYYRKITEQYTDEQLKQGLFNFKDGFLDLTKKLKEQGYKICLATSSKRPRAEMMFEKKNMDVNKYFDVCIFGEDVGMHAKPDPMIYRLCADRLDFKYENCMVVEDAINGVKGAYDGHFIPVMAVDLIEPDDYCKKVCKYIVRNLFELESILELNG